MFDHPTILLLEDCPVTGVLLERIILTHLPDCRPVWARSLAEARELADGLCIDLFILDICLPDGSGLDFLWEITTSNPAARAIVLSSSTEPEHEVQSMALGVLQFLKKPVPSEVLTGFLDEMFATGEAETEETFCASFKHLTILDIIQLKCLSAATTVMEVSSGKQMGRLHFREGNIVHAETEESAGVPALRSMFSWRKGLAREVPIDSCTPETIHCPWEALLMEMAQAIDEHV